MASTPGARAEVRRTVTDDDTAPALGSGDVPVLATPRLLAWCEAATAEAAGEGLGPGETTVGVRVVLDHSRATPVGAQVVARASVASVEGRLVVLDVDADHHLPDGTVEAIGRGQVTRAVVDRARFIARLPGGAGTPPVGPQSSSS